MKTIKNTSFDPFYNLALEEFLLKNNEITDDLFFLWRNKKCVVIGRNQNPFNEINIEYAKKHDIDIVRRSTGGGTVYHDEGNINFTFITSTITDRLSNYEFFLEPIISILNTLGIQAEFSPKTHIFVGDHKISGNAQVFYKNRMIHHGTLLFEVNSKHLQNVLTEKAKIDTYAIGSERSTVINIKDILSVDINITEFMDYILEQMGFNRDDEIELSQEQQNQVQELAKSKYHKREWVYGQTPKFIIHKDEYNFVVTNGLISKTSHYEELLIGQRFNKAIISKLLAKHRDKDKIISILFK